MYEKGSFKPFCKRGHSQEGRSGRRCVQCHRNSQSNYQKRNKEKVNSYHRSYRKVNGKAVRTSEYKSELRRYFGISLEQYNEMLQRQNECCKICKKHVTTFKKALAVDHNHKTGKIRGLLCNNCNRSLGFFYDDISKLENAILYLKENN